MGALGRERSPGVLIPSQRATERIGTDGHADQPSCADGDFDHGARGHRDHGRYLNRDQDVHANDRSSHLDRYGVEHHHGAADQYGDKRSEHLDGDGYQHAHSGAKRN
jgi:hypothetical protein